MVSTMELLVTDHQHGSATPVNKPHQASERRIKCLRMLTFIHDATLT